MADPESVQYIVPAEYANVSPDAYLKSKGSLAGAGESAVMMGVITVNNIRVAILAFATGLTLGIGTTAVLFFNGVFMGSFCSIFGRAGKSLELFSLLVPHGLIEVLSILITGAAGFLLARALLFPGDRTRSLALRENGKEALKLFLGTLPIILAAMLIESTLSKFHVIGMWPKYFVGVLALTGVLAWLMLSGRNRNRESRIKNRE